MRVPRGDGAVLMDKGMPGKDKYLRAEPSASWQRTVAREGATSTTGAPATQLCRGWQKRLAARFRRCVLFVWWVWAEREGGGDASTRDKP